ncbi:MAG: 4Fe-4S ferredoxin, partial [Chloroflexi bacterium]|nr:4Fe-4S ferredoxin [Chloroflexota bacterium]
REVRDGELQPSCAQAGPSNTLVFGNLMDPESRVAQLVANQRHYVLMGDLGTEPAVTYLKKVDPHAADAPSAH